MNARGIRLTQLACESGVPISTLTGWLLRRSKARLNDKNLALIAAWIGIEIEDAIRLQGGTVKERRHEIVFTKIAQSEKYQARHKLFVKGASLPKRLGRRGAKKRAEKYRQQGFSGLSDDHRKRISAGRLRYFKREDAKRPGWHNETLLGRAHLMLASLRRYRPYLSEEECEDEAVRRLLQPPYKVGSKEIARRLLRPKRKRQAGPQLNRERCRELLQLMSEKGWDGMGHAPHEFDVEFGNRIDLHYRSAREWRVRNLEGCLARRRST
jgi:transcriptional regulator with XRE-family HTH domain